MATETDPRVVTRADVYKAGRRAARLERTQAGIRFEYLPDYTGAPVSHSLPTSEQPSITPGGAVPPFFAGLLPEGRRLTALRNLVKTSSDDELSLLLAVGSDMIGDITVHPEGTSTSPAAPLIDGSEFSFAELRTSAGVVDRQALPGMQDKASGAMTALPVKLGGTDAIVKLDPPEYPHAVENEAYFLGLARSLRLPVANSELITDRDGIQGLVVERFDRVQTDTDVAALAVEDACQLAGRYPADKYRFTSAELISEVARVCHAEPVARLSVFQMLVFAWLTGNGDLHAKNVSVLQHSDGEWTPAPIYDVPSTLPYGDHSMALDVAGARENLTRRSWQRLAEQVGLPSRSSERAIDEVLRVTAPMCDDLLSGASPFSKTTTRNWVRQLARRREDCS